MTNRAAFCSSCGTELPAGATAGGPCRTCGATPTPPPTYAGVLDPAETLAEQIRRQLLQDLIDATIGEYDIIGELGRGGMASVFLAHEIALDRKVAIKVMAPALMASPGMAERFKREARLSANLSHPNILPIFSVRETEKLVFFVMKCLMGRPLDAVLKNRGEEAGWVGGGGASDFGDGERCVRHESRHEGSAAGGGIGCTGCDRSAAVCAGGV